MTVKKIKDIEGGAFLYYPNVIKGIKKNSNPLQPIFEAFTNALESLYALNKEINETSLKEYTICIRIYYSSLLLPDTPHKLNKIEVEDNGIGFNDSNFERFLRYKDSRKGYNNRGSGRVQFLHFFKNTKFESVYPKDNDGFIKRSFFLTKEKIQNNIIGGIYADTDSEGPRKTTVTFTDLISIQDQNYYDKLSLNTFKDHFISHYISKLCAIRNNLPQIIFEQYLDGSLELSENIKIEDIPSLYKQNTFDINYVTLKDNKITTTQNHETFILKSFKIENSILNKNEILFTSKDEVVRATKPKIDLIQGNDSINENRFLFLLSSDYIDKKDSDNRGTLNLLSSDKYLKQYKGLFEAPEVILLDKIETITKDIIINNYPEIKEENDAFNKRLEKLKSMFLIKDEIIDNLSLSFNDSEEQILTKVYQAESKQLAKRDSNIKKIIEELENLDTSAEDYEQKLLMKSAELTKEVPLQNRTSLTQYVARRKIVLDLFDKILLQNLQIQKTSTRNKNEKLIHNLLFKQGSDNPNNSNLWILNEEFIYFKGASEQALDQIYIGDKKLFSDLFIEVETEYLTSLGENRLKKRPDILLFPEEQKCIIIELKDPNVNASHHLSQIDFYASLILNYTSDDFNINTFYGYLIGENIEERDVLGRVGRYEYSYHFDYFFRPSEPVRGFDGKKDGSIYSEVLKYSSILKRAKLRNKIFIDKITQTKEDE